MAEWNGRLVWIGGVSLILLAGTLIANTWAVVATSHIGKAQTQAYLAIESGEIEFVGDWLNVDFVLKNVGKSPAKSVWTTAEVTISESRSDRSFSFKSQISAHHEAIPTGLPSAGHCSMRTSPEARAMFAERPITVIALKTRYRDVFWRVHKPFFVITIEPTTKTSGRFNLLSDKQPNHQN